jgi:hypothetical protein
MRVMVSVSGKRMKWKKAPAQERVRQLLLVVAGDDHDGSYACFDELARFVDPEFHAVELEQQVVWKLDVGLVYLVDQQHSLLLRRKRLPELATDDVIADVVDLRVAELRVAQTRNRVVLIQPVLRLRRRLDVPAKQRLVECAGDFFRQLRLAGAGLALHEQRSRECHRRVDGHHQVVRGDVTVCALEFRGRGSAGLGHGQRFLHE